MFKKYKPVFIQNCAMVDVERKNHIDPGENSLLIQIVDIDTEFPKPSHKFKKILQYRFLDIEKKDVEENIGWDKKCIQDEHAKEIVDALKFALENKMHVIVHCVAGVCRSGAVAEVGVMMGFEDTGVYRQPNLLVKHKLMKELGWTYDEEEKPDDESWRNMKI